MLIKEGRCKEMIGEREAGGVVSGSQNEAAGGAPCSGRKRNSGDGENVGTASKPKEEERHCGIRWGSDYRRPKIL